MCSPSVEFSLFGSILRADFRSDSDVDVLVTFAPDARVSLFDLVDMQDELKDVFGRDVDLVEKEAIQQSDLPDLIRLLETIIPPE